MVNETDYEKLEKRVSKLENRAKRNAWHKVLTWLGAVVVSGIALPTGLLLIKHFFFDLPAKSDDFQGRVEHSVQRVDGPPTSIYTITIMNTGWRMAQHRIGRVEIRSEGKVIAITPEFVPEGTTFTPGKIGTGKTSETAGVCEMRDFCSISWSNLPPNGIITITFRIRGRFERFPKALYGSGQITNWSCTNLPNNHDKACRANDLGSAPDRGGGNGR